MARAGDGNIRSSESIVTPEDFSSSLEEERVLMNLTVKVTSGGLKDFILVSFHPELNSNIHVAKPVEMISFGEIVFNPQRNGAQWFEAEGIIKGQLIPRVGTSDRLGFIITSKKNVDQFLSRFTSCTMTGSSVRRSSTMTGFTSTCS